MTNSIAVVGSINVDSILHIDRLPQPGETISMQTFSKAAGGKGANQAVAAARAGAKVAFIGGVGHDDNGRFMLHQMAADGIDTQGVTTFADAQTGQAYILLQASGQNSIIVQHGANFVLRAEHIMDRQATLTDVDYTIAQFEVPTSVIQAAFDQTKAVGHHTILNPAPAQTELSDKLLAVTDLIVPNETESGLITGIAVTDLASMQANAAWYHDHGVQAVIITLGAKGSYVSYGDLEMIVPAFKVKAVDTTAAGDTFIGALAAELNPDFSNFETAIRYASMSSAFTVQTLGAFPSIPQRQTVVDVLTNR
ncbi:ribokinase [Lacticaseibacillus porcinae]|uniref:ribokinase n=1 Tax=Lacticaseibacillus porcinae TaxID=1123687 RepID=UPI000F7AD736|nr:ribokinase [Lacticaseibacillus porcinae]